ncbi:ammonium transporter [Clostridiales bacterium FE2010]|nr:ammonium transporter [Clostridiales bacterium FE2010]
MTFSAANTIWVLLGAALVFFMQAGFAMCEAGFTRAKNTGNILMKNLMDFCIGTPLYWLFGYGIMFGAGTALFGWIDPFIMKDYSHILPAGVPLWAYAIFQTVFCATSATIVSGAMAERTKFSAYCIYSAAISLFIYPVSGHWIWGGGFLAEMGFHDFAGSTAVHMVGGVCALIGAKILGPRVGKYGKDGKPRAILGHNLSIAALGVFILWFCWFGFNGASTVGMDSDELIGSASLVFFNTNLAAAVATLTTMIFTWFRYGKPDVSMTFNAALAGLVGITAGCDAVDPFGAALIGLACGFVIVFAVEFFDKVVKIDDPVGAISVHGVCGSLGTILTGLFATGGTTMKGVFYGGGFKFFGIQVLGVLCTIAWTAAIIAVVFLLIKKTIGLRADAADEVMGLDRSEHGLLTAYSGFAILPEEGYDAPAAAPAPVAAAAPVAEAVPVAVKKAEKMLGEPSATASGGYFAEGEVNRNKQAPQCGAAPIEVAEKPVYTRVQIICRPASLESLKKAMNGIGITGMTVTNVMGYGAQKGKPEYYRGTPVEVTLLPKVQVDIVVSKIPVSEVVETARGVLYTGHIGDGKIFVQDVENVIRVRTGEEGYDALQSDE